ncbi:hypothetical protein HPB49_003501 [Dermacentor silvarum]|uniref:Uncharacterized protein n=1 Tax=Dermacentor silvarum TaxID=543639 RepID=A0ACB8DMN1_DERSI|nr:hypothetical protein HPB49_003501 [Dermacentor silvarum]
MKLLECNTAARQMSSRNTWRLFRALVDPTETQKHLQRATHAFPGNTTQLAQKLRDQYLCTAQDSLGSAYSYAGRENTEQDQPFHLRDLRAALAKTKRGTAPGRNKLTVKLLVNLPNTAYSPSSTTSMQCCTGPPPCQSTGKRLW